MNSLNDINYANKVKNARQAAYEIGLAARYGHKEIIECTHDLALIARFPHDFFLNYQLMLTGISLYSSPLQIDNLMMEVFPDIGIPKMHTFLKELLLRIRGPALASEIETYNKLVYDLNESFSEFFTQFRIIADVIFDEFTSSISSNAIKAGKALQKASNDLLQFVQLYPNSAHAALFSKTMNKIIPPGEFLNEVSMWCSYRYPFPLEFLKNSPSTVKMREEGIQILKEYCPRYPSISQSLKETADGILNSVPDCPPVISNNIGPFQTTLKRWYVILAFLIFLGLPLLIYIMFINEMNYMDGIAADISAMYGVEKEMIALDSYSSLFRMIMDNSSQDPYLESLFYNITSKQAIADLCRELQNVISVDTYTLSTYYAQKEFLGFLFTRSAYSDGYEKMNYRRLFTYINAAVEESIIDNVPIHTYETSSFGNLLFEEISEALITEIDSWKDHGQNTSKWSILAFTLVCILINAICGMVIILEFLNGRKRLNLFIDSLRATIKNSTRKISNLFRQFAEIFPRHTKEGVGSIEKKDDGKSPVTVAIVAIVLYCVVASAMEIAMVIINKCHAQKLNHRAIAFREFSILNLGLAKIAMNSISLFFSDQINNTEALSQEIFNTISNIKDPGNIMGPLKICPTCSLVSVLDKQIVHNGLSASKTIYPWISMVSTTIRAMSNNKEVFKKAKYNVSTGYYYNVLPVMTIVMDNLNLTTIEGIDSLVSMISVLFVVIALLFLVLLFTFVMMNKKGDEVFRTVMYIMAHFKRKDLAQQTLDIVEHNEYAMVKSDYNLSNDSYDKLVTTMPSAAIVIDFSLTIFSANRASSYLFKDPSIAEGSKFFESMKLDLIDIDRGTKLRTIIDQYLYGDCDMIEEHTVMHEGKDEKNVYNLTILPLFPSDASDKMSRKLALLFNDISESVRQRKLLEQRRSRPIEIMNDWLPTEISEQFVEKHTTPFFAVNSGIIVVIKVCGLVKDVSSKHPENCISIIEQIFRVFDSVVVNYKMITKLRTHSDTCVLGSGIFFHGLNRIHALETLKCCFELLSCTKNLNQTISANIQLKIGASLGGPFVAGVLGPQHPWFDAWGQTVDEALMLSDTAQPGSVNMNSRLHDVAKELHVNFVGSEQGDAFMVKPK